MNEIIVRLPKLPELSLPQLHTQKKPVLPSLKKLKVKRNTGRILKVFNSNTRYKAKSIMLKSFLADKEEKIITAGRGGKHYTQGSHYTHF